MSSTTTKSTTYRPKATFTVYKTKSGERKFTAVNKRAKIVAKKLGKRKHLSVQELRSSVGKGSYEFYAYKNNDLSAKQLVKIRF